MLLCSLVFNMFSLAIEVSHLAASMLLIGIESAASSSLNQKSKMNLGLCNMLLNITFSLCFRILIELLFFHILLNVTVTFQQLPQKHWGFYQSLNWAWLAWVRRKTHSVIWWLMEQTGTTGNNFKQLYSHISQITYHITVT